MSSLFEAPLSVRQLTESKRERKERRKKEKARREREERRLAKAREEEERRRAKEREEEERRLAEEREEQARRLAEEREEEARRRAEAPPQMAEGFLAWLDQQMMEGPDSWRDDGRHDPPSRRRGAASTAAAERRTATSGEQTHSHANAQGGADQVKQAMEDEELSFEEEEEEEEDEEGEEDFVDGCEEGDGKDEDEDEEEEEEEANLTEYELQRLRRIEENKRLMIATGIMQAAEGLGCGSVKKGRRQADKKRKRGSFDSVRLSANPAYIQKLRSQVPDAEYDCLLLADAERSEVGLRMCKADESSSKRQPDENTIAEDELESEVSEVDLGICEEDDDSPERQAAEKKVFTVELEAEQGIEQGVEQVVQITSWPFVVGRGKRSGLIIRDTKVSTEHCILYYCAEAGGHCQIQDVSRSGVRVNGVRLSSGRRVPIEAGSRVSLGKKGRHVFRLRVKSEMETLASAVSEGIFKEPSGDGSSQDKTIGVCADEACARIVKPSCRKRARETDRDDGEQEAGLRQGWAGAGGKEAACSRVPSRAPGKAKLLKVKGGLSHKGILDLEDAIDIVFRRLKARHVGRLAGTCRGMCSLIDASMIWKFLYAKTFLAKGCLEQNLPAKMQDLLRLQMPSEGWKKLYADMTWYTREMKRCKQRKASSTTHVVLSCPEKSCGKKFKSPFNLHRHLRGQDDGRDPPHYSLAEGQRYYCSQQFCMRHFPTATRALRHTHSECKRGMRTAMLRDFGIGTFVCSTCQASFRFQCAYDSHFLYANGRSRCPSARDVCDDVARRPCARCTNPKSHKAHAAWCSKCKQARQKMAATVLQGGGSSATWVSRGVKSWRVDGAGGDDCGNVPTFTALEKQLRAVFCKRVEEFAAQHSWPKTDGRFKGVCDRSSVRGPSFRGKLVFLWRTIELGYYDTAVKAAIANDAFLLAIGKPQGCQGGSFVRPAKAQDLNLLSPPDVVNGIKPPADLLAAVRALYEAHKHDAEDVRRAGTQQQNPNRKSTRAQPLFLGVGPSSLHEADSTDHVVKKQKSTSKGRGMEAL